MFIKIFLKKKAKPKCKIQNLVRTTDLKRTFSKGDTINLSYNMYQTTEIVNDTIPSYRLDTLPERYYETFLKNRKSTMKDYKHVNKALGL